MSNPQDEIKCNCWVSYLVMLFQHVWMDLRKWNLTSVHRITNGIYLFAQDGIIIFLRNPPPGVTLSLRVVKTGRDTLIEMQLHACFLRWSSLLQTLQPSTKTESLHKLWLELPMKNTSADVRNVICLTCSPFDRYVLGASVDRGSPF